MRFLNKAVYYFVEEKTASHVVIAHLGGKTFTAIPVSPVLGLTYSFSIGNNSDCWCRNTSPMLEDSHGGG